MEEAALEILKNNYFQKGYVTFDEIVKVADEFALDLSSIERISGHLLDEKVIILEEIPPQETGVVVENEEYDRSQTDYELVFSEVIRLEPKLADYIEQVKDIPAPRLREEHRLIIQAQKGNHYARNRLIRMFLKVVIRIALDYHKVYGVPLEDAIQEGNIGLIKAVEKFDPQPGHRYSSYAPWWIRQNIMRNLDGQWTYVYFPQYVKDVLFHISKIVGTDNLSDAKGNLNDIASNEDIALWTNQTASKISEYAIFFDHHANIKDLRDISEEHFWERPVEEEIITIIFVRQFRESLEAGPLGERFKSDRNKNIFMLRYGLSDQEPMTLEEIGETVGLTRERVRQILSRIETIVERIFRAEKFR